MTIVQKFSVLGTPTHYAQGSEILAQGESCARIGVILSGLVTIGTLNHEGEDRVLQVLQAGQFLGYPSQRQSAFFWRAATDVELGWVTPSTLLAAWRENPAIHLNCVEAIARQMQQHYLFTQALRERSTLQRVAYWLMAQIAPDRPEGGMVQLRILLSRRDLASLLDMTVETLCRVLRQLDDSGAITLLATDRVVIRNPVKLRLLAKLPQDGQAMPVSDEASPGTNLFCEIPRLSGDRDKETGRLAAPLAVRRAGGDRRHPI